jgi:hypothetical protein
MEIGNNVELYIDFLLNAYVNACYIKGVDKFCEDEIEEIFYHIYNTIYNSGISSMKQIDYIEELRKIRQVYYES